MSRVLLVLSSHDRLGFTSHRSGVWIDEFATPWFSYTDAGHEVVVASPTGGPPPIDPASLAESAKGPWTHRFEADPAAVLALESTVPLAYVDPRTIDAVHVPGGYPQLVDVVGNPDVVRIVESVFVRGGPVALVCHGIAILRDVRSADGRPLARGRRVTSFSRSEEESLGLLHAVPFVVEDLLQDLGAEYVRNEVDFAPCVVRDGGLVTGQNPSSTEGVVREVLDLLAGR